LAAGSLAVKNAAAATSIAAGTLSDYLSGCNSNNLANLLKEGVLKDTADEVADTLTGTGAITSTITSTNKMRQNGGFKVE